MPNETDLRHWKPPTEPGTVGFQLRQMFFRPMADGVQGLDQGPAERGESVFHFRRDDRMHFARDEAVAFETAQCLGQHLLRNPADLALQRGITPRPGGEDVNDQRRPLVGDPAEDDAGKTMRVHDGSASGTIGMDIF